MLVGGAGGWRGEPGRGRVGGGPRCQLRRCQWRGNESLNWGRECGMWREATMKRRGKERETQTNVMWNGAASRRARGGTQGRRGEFEGVEGFVEMLEIWSCAAKICIGKFKCMLERLIGRMTARDAEIPAKFGWQKKGLRRVVTVLHCFVVVGSGMI